MKLDAHPAARPAPPKRQPGSLWTNAAHNAESNIKQEANHAMHCLPLRGYQSDLARTVHTMRCAMLAARLPGEAHGRFCGAVWGLTMGKGQIVQPASILWAVGALRDAPPRAYPISGASMPETGR